MTLYESLTKSPLLAHLVPRPLQCWYLIIHCLTLWSWLYWFRVLTFQTPIICCCLFVCFWKTLLPLLSILSGRGVLTQELKPLYLIILLLVIFQSIVNIFTMLHLRISDKFRLWLLVIKTMLLINLFYITGYQVFEAYSKPGYILECKNNSSSRN